MSINAKKTFFPSNILSRILNISACELSGQASNPYFDNWCVVSLENE